MAKGSYVLSLGDIRVHRRGVSAQTLLLRETVQEWLYRNRGKECEYTGRQEPVYGRLEGLAHDGKAILRFEENGKSRTLNVPRGQLIIFEPAPEQNPGPEEESE
jgi:hypothetical protein